MAVWTLSEPGGTTGDVLVSACDSSWLQWASQIEKVPMGSALLDKLKVQHTDSFGWALSCCNWEKDIAEDVLQESYLRVLDGRAAFAGRSSMKTWFFGVIRRVAAETRRARRRRSLLSLGAMEVFGGAAEEISADTQESPSQGMYQEEHSRQLQSALLALPRRQREVIHLVFYSDLTLEEAARTLGISPGSSRTHYHRAKQRLAKILDFEETHETQA